MATVKLPSSATTPVPAPNAQSGPPPPLESKPDVAAALAPAAPASTANTSTENKPVPTGPKSTRIIPAIPLPSPAIKHATTTNGTAKPANGASEQANSQKATTTKSFEEANNDARAAVAAAMAKLPNNQKAHTESPAMENLTKKVNEMRTNEPHRSTRPPAGGHQSSGNRGRGGHRGGRGGKIDVPKADYDFESANAKFNKQDLVKEAIATSSPIGDEVNTFADRDTAGAEGRKSSEASITIPPPASYNKSSSFFDDISSEIKDRAAGQESGQKFGGRDFRNEERQKNFETFGQGSVDNNFRYGRGGRGRGRGRGYGGGRGRGSYDNRGRGSSRGAHAIPSSDN